MTPKQKLDLAIFLFVAFFGAIIIEVVRAGASVAVFGRRAFFMGNGLVLSVRPRIAELVFQLYGRSLHPELFEVHRSRQIERGGYTATVQITNAGHSRTNRANANSKRR